MANKNMNKIAGLDSTELAKQLGESKEQMFRIRFQMSLGQADGLKKLRQLRKDRARMLTVQRQRELEREMDGSATAAAATPGKAKTTKGKK